MTTLMMTTMTMVPMEMEMTVEKKNMVMGTMMTMMENTNITPPPPPPLGKTHRGKRKEDSAEGRTNHDSITSTEQNIHTTTPQHKPECGCQLQRSSLLCRAPVYVPASILYIYYSDYTTCQNHPPPTSACLP